MKNIFRALFIAFILSASFTQLTAAADNARGQKSVGLRAGFSSRNTTATAGLYFSYRFTEHFRFSPKMDYAFRHNHVDAFSFNFDAEMPISLSPTTNRVNFYPIAGLNFTTATSHSAATELNARSSDDSSQRINRFGLNLGAGIEYFASPTLRLALEAKAQILKQQSGAWISASIGYVF